MEISRTGGAHLNSEHPDGQGCHAAAMRAGPGEGEMKGRSRSTDDQRCQRLCQRTLLSGELARLNNKTTTAWCVKRFLDSVAPGADLMDGPICILEIHVGISIL